MEFYPTHQGLELQAATMPLHVAGSPGLHPYHLLPPRECRTPGKEGMLGCGGKIEEYSGGNVLGIKVKGKMAEGKENGGGGKGRGWVTNEWRKGGCGKRVQMGEVRNVGPICRF